MYSEVYPRLNIKRIQREGGRASQLFSRWKRIPTSIWSPHSKLRWEFAGPLRVTRLWRFHKQGTRGAICKSRGHCEHLCEVGKELASEREHHGENHLPRGNVTPAWWTGVTCVLRAAPVATPHTRVTFLRGRRFRVLSHRILTIPE